MYINMVGFLIAALILTSTFVVGLWLGRRHVAQHQKFMDEYLHADRAIYAHIREHILRERDWSWAINVPPITTFGIKADGTLMSNQELAEARRMAQASQAEKEKEKGKGEK